MTRILLVTAGLLVAGEALAQEEPNHPDVMKSGQVTLQVPPDTWLAIDVLDYMPQRPDQRDLRNETQINLYRDGKKVYERNNYNPKQPIQFLVKAGRAKEVYFLRGFTKNQPPDKEPPYNKWYAMPFREKRDDNVGSMELTFDTDLKWNYYTCTTVVRVRYFEGILTEEEVQKIRNQDNSLGGPPVRNAIETLDAVKLLEVIPTPPPPRVERMGGKPGGG
jgi:hypothetical protein